MNATDVEAIRLVAEVSSNLDAHIQRRANEIAQREIALVSEDAERRIAELEGTITAWERRHGDLIAEIRRKDAATDKYIARLREENKTLKATVDRVWAVRRWTNEDGKSFVFTEDVVAALKGEEAK